MRSTRPLPLAVAAVIALLGSASALALDVAVDHLPQLPIVLAVDAVVQERTAATELATYLGLITSAEFEILSEDQAAGNQTAIWVGPSQVARDNGIDCTGLGREEWRILSVTQGLILCGGRPRGTLYAVYHFLEDELGVRWWTPYEQTVPRSQDLTLEALDRQGQPAFIYRDVHGVDGPREFNARNRLNGHFALLDWAHGGVEGYGSPRSVHNFYNYVPPAEFFVEHPEYFSEIGGLRYGGEGQLCLTNDELLALVIERVKREIATSLEDHKLLSTPAPRLFAFSQNDWGRACTCDDCQALVDREGSRSGPNIYFINQLAAAIAEDYPDILLDTLAYGYAVVAPRSMTVHENVVIRYAGLYSRDYSRAARSEANREYRTDLAGWSSLTPHLRIWDYAVTFGDDGDLPHPNLAFMQSDYLLYQEMGAEGLFVQHENPIGADLRDAKLWMMTKLLEQPSRDYRSLWIDFSDGYHGSAGRFIRRYLDMLVAAVDSADGRLRFDAPAAEFSYLDRRFIRRAQRLFTRAAEEVQGDPVLRRRLSHARLSLDTATLSRWSELSAGCGARPVPCKAFPLDFSEILERYRQTWLEQIRFRIPAAEQAGWREDLDDDIDEVLLNFGGGLDNDLIIR